MKHWKAVPPLALALLSFTIPRGGERGGAAVPAAAASGLWQKAVEIHRRNNEWYPGRISILSEVLNRRGEPYSVTQLFFSLSLEADGRMRTELVRALKNGEDTTEKMKARVKIRSPQESMDPEKEETYSVTISDSPFDPERQKSVAFSPRGERQVLFGHSCRRFDFTYRTTIVRKGKPEELTWTGMAWLEEGSGLPVKLEFSLEPLPSRIRSLWTVYLYETARPDKWVLSHVQISGQGGFLFIKKRFRSTTTFSDYRLPPPKAAVK